MEIKKRHELQISLTSMELKEIKAGATYGELIQLDGKTYFVTVKQHTGGSA